MPAPCRITSHHVLRFVDAIECHLDRGLDVLRATTRDLHVRPRVPIETRHVVVQLTPFDFAFRPSRFARHRGRTAAGIPMSTEVRSQSHKSRFLDDSADDSGATPNRVETFPR